MPKIVVFILSILLISNCFSQDQLKFRHLSVKDGLSNNKVFCSLQDRQGFLWFGTASGLNRYDGYAFKVFEHIEGDTTSLSDNRIRAMAEDKDGKIWIGTNDGLNCFDPVTETCRRFYSTSNKEVALSDNRISAIHISKNGIIWIGTENGLNRFDPNTFTNTQITQELTLINNQTSKQINAITEDANGSIWVGMWWGGLKKIDQKTLSIENFFSDQQNKSGLTNDNVLNLYVDKNNYLWISCYMGGIRKMELRSHQFQLVKGFENAVSLGCMIQDQSGNMWMSSGVGSLAIVKVSDNTIRTEKNSLNDPSTISTGTISSILCDRSGIVWITTDKDICLYDPNGQRFAPFYRQLKLDKRDHCRSFYQDIYKQLWIDVYDVGLVRYNPRTGEKRILRYKEGDKNSINHPIILGISGDHSGAIWVATNNGICIVDAKTCQVIDRKFYIKNNSIALLNTVNAHTTCNQSRYFWIKTVDSLRIMEVGSDKEWQFSTTSIASLNRGTVNCIIGSRQGDLWIGTESFGINRYQPSTGKITVYAHQPTDTASISNNSIKDIFEDRQGYLWIATQNGLNRFDPKLNVFKRFGIKQGLSSNDCFSVKEDTNGMLWIVNSVGIDKLDLKTERIFKYADLDDISLNSNGFYQTDDGLFIGGHSENGFYMFRPDHITENKVVQPVYLTDFILFNESVPVSSPQNITPLTKSISYTDQVILNHNQSAIGFEFSTLTNTSPEKNRYEYKLDGFDNHWFQTSGNRRRINYTNLYPGSYVFKVRAANSDGLWNSQEASVKIQILYPWWKTGWAYSFYFIVIAFITIMIRKYFKDKQNLQQKIAIQQIESSKNLELAQLKQQFFTNISHEYKTPLTLISGPVESLLKNIEHFEQPKIVDLLKLIHRNAIRLSQLTNQILDLRKLETNSMKLEISLGDFVGFIRSIANGFYALAEKKQIDYQIIIDNQIEINKLHWFDSDKLYKIISNLLSNAFKFTPENGRISISVKMENLGSNHQDSFYWHITIKDSGIGINKDQLDKIFERFYQVETTHKRTAEGTGIGLALTKDLIKLHNGSIEVESQEGQGSLFIVKLPADISNLANYTIVDEQNTVQLSASEATEVSAVSNKIFLQNHLDEESPLVLIVEDNEDMRLYIRNIVSDTYRILEAENGRIGIELATSQLPDLIISDVMMPEIDGYELTKVLKNDERTSHIPIILLTALSSTENIIHGLENEADGYLVKPFNEQMLLLSVNNMIQSRQKLKKRVIQFIEKSTTQPVIELQPEKLAIPSAEKLFLNKLMAIIENRIGDSSFDVPGFSSEIGMESSVFHRKLKAIINQSPGEFIRSMRMKRAAQLLYDKNLPINEIASMVGFENNTNYFSTVFRKYFGKSPSEYQNDN